MKRAFLTVALIGAFSFGCDGDGGEDCGDSPCGESQVCCDGTCVFTISDRNNCGGCGISCSGGSCSNGMCIAPVDAGNTRCGELRACGTECIERSVPQNTDGRSSPSFQNCNGCGIACDPMRASSCSVLSGSTTGTPGCLCGEFLQCPPGDVCINDGTTTRCTSLSNDNNNCGEIGNMCAEGLRCSGGMCVCGSAPGATGCAEGEACCEGECGTGTCCTGVGFVDLQNDAENCGECGTACGVNAPNCVVGACTCEAAGRACEAPVPGSIFPPADPVLGESCCPSVGCVANSNSNCACSLCSDEVECIVSGGPGIAFPGLPGGEEAPVDVCCGVEEIVLFPTPMMTVSCEGSLPLPTDGGVPDGGTASDAGIPSDAGTPTDAGLATDDAGADGGSMDGGV